MEGESKQNLNFCESDTKTSKKKDSSLSQSTFRPILLNQLTSVPKVSTVLWPKSMTLSVRTIRWSTKKIRKSWFWSYFFFGSSRLCKNQVGKWKENLSILLVRILICALYHAMVNMNWPDLLKTMEVNWRSKYIFETQRPWKIHSKNVPDQYNN